MAPSLLCPPASAKIRFSFKWGRQKSILFFAKKENKFIDRVAKVLELNSEKFQEIKKQKTAAVKFVNFGDKADESIFGIAKSMSKKEKLKMLRKEYSRWNALTNNSDKAIRERAREMRDLAANIRKQYT